MKATDKGLHDKVRTEAEARAYIVVQKLRGWACIPLHGNLATFTESDVKTLLDHIDTLAARIKELEKDVQYHKAALRQSQF